jgi:aldehyde dehydrogenase (NAD+)
MASTGTYAVDRMLIDGELVPAGTGRTFDNVNPATE